MSRRALAVAGFLLVALAGGVGLQQGCVARARFDPATASWGNDTFRIVERALGATGSHDLVRDGVVVATLAARRDAGCAHPWLALLDVDGDGSLDLYHHACGDRAYLRYRPATQTFEQVELGAGDASVLATFWGREVVRWHGLRLIGLGLVGLVLGLVGSLKTAFAAPVRTRDAAPTG